MSNSLRQMWGLNDTESAAAGSGPAEQFRRDFSEAMRPVNQALQIAAVRAIPSEYAALEAQRSRLYDAYQATLRHIDQADASRADRDIRRVLDAVAAVRTRTTSLAGRAEGLSREWQQHESELDELDDQIEELGAAEHPKAPTMRKLADAIRTRVNDRDYSQALTALSQVRPKVDGIHAQHDRQASDGDGASGSSEESEPRVQSSEESIEARAGFVGSSPITSAAPASHATAGPSTSEVSPTADVPRAGQRTEASQEPQPQDSVEPHEPVRQAEKPPMSERSPEEQSSATAPNEPETADAPHVAQRAEPRQEPQPQDTIEPHEPVPHVDKPPMSERSPEEQASRPAPEADASQQPDAASRPGNAPQSADAPREEGAEAPEDIGSVTVIVLDRITGPVASALVQVGDVSARSIRRPCTLELTPGRYRVRVTSDGYHDASAEVEIAAGESESIHIWMERRTSGDQETTTPSGNAPQSADAPREEGAEAPEDIGSVTVIVLDRITGPVASALVQVGDVSARSIRRPCTLELTPGRYRVRVTSDDYHDASAEVEIAAGESERIHIWMERRTSGEQETGSETTSDNRAPSTGAEGQPLAREERFRRRRELDELESELQSFRAQ